jgi:hypothetical protein
VVLVAVVMVVTDYLPVEQMQQMVQLTLVVVVEAVVNSVAMNLVMVVQAL